MKDDHLTNFRVDISPEAFKLLSLVKNDCEAKRIYVLLDDTGCCSLSNAFVTCRDKRVSNDDWVRIMEEDAIYVYANKMFVKTMTDGTLSLGVGPSDSESDSLSLETNYGKRLV